MSRVIVLVWLIVPFLGVPAAGQQQVPVVFSIDNAASEIAFDLSIPGSSDSDASSVSGTLEATLHVDTSGGAANITGIEFTGGAFMNDQPYNFTLSVLGFLTANLQGSDLVGTVSTPAPPAVVVQGATDPLSFQYDAADHIISVYEGTLLVSGAVNESLDLAQDPVSGIAPTGSFATIELIPGATVGGMTEFAATLTQPTVFQDTFNFDAGIINLPVTIDVSGQVIANATFSLPIAGGGELAGDYNGGGRVEQADLDLVLLNWGQELANPGAIGWFSNQPSGAVDQEELDAVLLNWGNAAAGATVAAAVPEPATWFSLICLASLGFVKSAVRRSRTKDHPRE
jgi:hypothetical protein